MDVVKKAFNSINRRFREGDEISAGDDVSPHDYADLQARGFISGAPRKTPSAIPAAADDHKT